MRAEINAASYQLSSSGRMKTSSIITSTKRSDGKGQSSVKERIMASEQPCQWPLQLLEANIPAWRICKMPPRCTLKKKGHTPELKWKQVGSSSAFQGGAEVRPPGPAGLQPALVCYLEAAEGGKSPDPEAVPPSIYSEAFIIELISSLQRDCQ